MIYPPCSSVFYTLNSSLEQIDIKKRNQINPELSETEIQAIFDSFRIVEGDKIIQHRLDFDRDPVPTTFASIIHDTLIYANRLPTARFWLRRIPAHIEFVMAPETETERNGMAFGNIIALSPQCLQNPVPTIVPTFIHELGHVIDRQSFTGLSVFPYMPVNQGDEWQLKYDDSLTEAEVMQLFLIEEAEKTALSKQLIYESGKGIQSRIYGCQADAYFRKYMRLYEKWLPPEGTGNWSNQEIEKERLMRAFFYTSIAAMTQYMKEFLKPYTRLITQIPLVIRKTYDSEIQSFVDLKKIRKMNLGLADVDRTIDVLDKMFINIQYREYAYLILCEQIQRMYRYYFQIKGDLTRQQTNQFRTEILPDPYIRLNLIPNEPSDYFKAYMTRMEGRYMGFMRQRDLKPTNSLVATYLYLNKSNPSKSLIDIDTSWQDMLSIKEVIKKDATKITSYFCQRIKAMENHSKTR